MVVKIGRGLSVIKRCSAFLTPHSTKHVLQALVLAYLDYCPVIWSSDAKKDLDKLQLAQNRAASLVITGLVLILRIPVSRLRVQKRLTASLHVFIRNIVSNNLHRQITHRTDTHTYPIRHGTRGLFTVPRSRTNSRKRPVLYRAMSAWNSLPSYSASEQQTWFQKTNKATHHGTMPLPHVTYLICVCYDMNCMCN